MGRSDAVDSVSAGDAAYRRFLADGGFWTAPVAPTTLEVATRHGLVGPWARTIPSGNAILRGLHVRSTRLLDFCSQISEALRTVGIAHAFLKGRLTARWWQHASFRPQTDVDLLVHPADAAAARNCFVKHLRATEAEAAANHQFHDTLQTPLGPLELHVGLSSDFRLNTSAQELLRRSTMHACEQISLSGLALEDELVHLAMHAATHGPGRLLWLYDLREIAERVPRSTWAAVAERAAVWNVVSAAWWGLFLAKSRLSAQIELDPFERLLRSTLKTRILRKLALGEWSADSHQRSMRLVRLALADDGALLGLGRGAFRSLRRWRGRG